MRRFWILTTFQSRRVAIAQKMEMLMILIRISRIRALIVKRLHDIIKT